MIEKRVQLGVTLRESVVHWLKEQAADESRTVSAQLERLLMERIAAEARGKAARKPPQAANPGPLLKAIDDAKAS